MTPSHREADPTECTAAYLLQPAKPCPQFLGGEIVWFPGNFGPSIAKRPVWNAQTGDWIYAWEGDEQKEAA